MDYSAELAAGASEIESSSASATTAVSASGWFLGIFFSVLASVIGGASKLAIRKSWLMEQNRREVVPLTHEDVNGRGSPEVGDGDGDGDGDGSYCNGDGGCYEPPPGVGVLDEMVGGDCVGGGGDFDDGSSNEDDGSDRFADDSDSAVNRLRVSPSLVAAAAAECEEHRSAKTKRTARCLRLSGMIGMTFLNPLCCVVAMNFASPSLLAPFSGLTLVWIVSFSEMLIGERPLPRQIAAAGLILTGEVVVSVWGDHTADDGTSIADVARGYKDPAFVAYLACMAAWMGVLWRWMTHKSTRPSLRRFAWGVGGGSVTGLQNFLKDSLTILKRMSETSAPMPWFLPLLTLCGMATAFGGLLLLTACMKRYDATYSAAAFVGSFVVSASIMCQVRYDTASNLAGVVNYVMYPLGLAVLLVGVLVLVRETKEDNDAAAAEVNRGTEEGNGNDNDREGTANDGAENGIVASNGDSAAEDESQGSYRGKGQDSSAEGYHRLT